MDKSDKTQKELQEMFRKLVDKYGDDGTLHTFEFCTTEGAGLADSTIDAVECGWDGSISFAYNENTGDREPLCCFRTDELQEFHDRLKEYLETGGEQ